jgi:hypothetical protein
MYFRRGGYLLAGLLALLASAGCRLPTDSIDAEDRDRTLGRRAQKAITEYSFETLGAVGAIDENAKTIAVNVPSGTNVTALVATFTTTGSIVKVAGVVQVSGTTANNFSNPVIYKVKALNGSTASYTVTVTVQAEPPASSEKAITAFGFGEAVGAIDENARTIGLTVPFGTGVTALIASFAITGETLTVNGTEQVSGVTPNDFTAPVRYTVTAEDGSFAEYTVTVTVAADPSSKAITVFLFLTPYAEATIDEAAKIIQVAMPPGTDVSALVASFLTTGSSVRVGSTLQQSGATANNFSNPVIYTVTAADGSTANYTATVTVPTQSSAKEITSFWMLGAGPWGDDAWGTIDESAKTIAVQNEADLSALVAGFETTGARVVIGSTEQVSGVTVNDFSAGPIVYTVIARDGTTASYEVSAGSSGGIPCSFYPCPQGYVCGYDGYCVPHCFDGEWNGDEGDVDCGGSCAARCAAGQHCWSHSDCASQYCYYDVCQ